MDFQKNIKHIYGGVKMEYEYSFNVKDLNPYINYCNDNDYQLIEETNQSRTIYRNENKTMARITIKEKNNNIRKLLDFKDDILTDDILIERRESKSIEFNDDEAINSILEFLNYKKDNTLIRKRYVYKKNNVKFELDDYDAPKKAYVVAIEGEKTEVDKVYQDIIKKLNKI